MEKSNEKLADPQILAYELGKWNEMLERFRNYNNGSEEDILCMIDDWAVEREGMS